MLPLIAAPRSRDSLQESFVLFVNTSERHVNLYWIDYRGHHRFCVQMSPQANHSVNTFRSHPWLFRDGTTGEFMHVHNNIIFWPQTYSMRHPRHPTQLVQCRKLICIHFPMRTLRETCLWAVLNTIDRKSSQPLDKLCLPDSIKTDLQFLFDSIDKFERSMGITFSGE